MGDTQTGIRTFLDEGLGHLSYVVDLGNGTAAMIDPPRFPTEQTATLRAAGLSLRWTLDTHSHADYVTGSPALADEHDVTMLAPAAADLATPHEALVDGDRAGLAPGVGLRAIATPGHTPDHHAYVLEHDGAPVALFTGGSLMVGAIGRTDLCGPELAAPLAREMYRSLRRFDSLPDDLAVHPTHGAGSFCSAPASAALATTLGWERATNRLLGISDEDRFVVALLAGLGTFPSYFRDLPELNRRGPRRFARLPELRVLDVDHVARHVAGGGVLVDVRPIADFAAGHVPGSLSNALRPVFGSWLGWLVELGRPLVFVAGADQDNDQHRDELVRQCLDVGHEHLVGELDGGIDAWAASGREVASIGLVGPGAADPDADLDTTIIDVRQLAEYRSGHVPGAVHAELGSIAARSGAGLPLGPLLVMCGHGERAMTAAGLLAARGRQDVRVFDGGPAAWAQATGLRLAP